MGKRKMHGQVYYQCDWTAYPMKQAFCFMPMWQGDKLVKRGSYCNWPSVVAHAQHLFEEGSMTEKQLDDVRLYVHSQAGPVVDHGRLHFSNLEHFHMPSREDARNYNMAEYMSLCAVNEAPLTFVKVACNGTVTECMTHPVDGKYNIEDVIRAPGTDNEVTAFSSLRKIRGASKDTNLFVFHATLGNEPNQTASQLFKLQLYGDVAIVQIQKANGLPPRERYINFTVDMYNELFSKKRRRSTAAEVSALTPEEYQSVKEAMQTSLIGYEAQLSSGAESLADKGAVMPAPTGAELAEVARVLGNVPPKKKARLEERLCAPAVPPPVSRQVSVAA